MSGYHEDFKLPERSDRSSNPLPFFLFSLASLLVVILSKEFPAPLLTIAFFLIWLLGVGNSPRRILKRLLGPLYIGVLLFIMQSLFHGKEVLALIDFGLFKVSVFREGLLRGLLLLSKTIAGSLIMVNVSVNLSILEFLSCLSSLKIPEIIIFEALLTYRYVFLLRDEAQRLRQAQAIRGGYIDRCKGIRSASLIGSTLIISSLERASRIQEANRLRIGTGSGVPTFSHFSSKRVDLVEVVLLSLALVTFLASWRVFHVNC